MSRIEQAKALYESGVKEHIVRKRFGLTAGDMVIITGGKEIKRLYKKPNTYLSLLDGDKRYKCIVTGSGFRPAPRKCNKNPY